MHQDKRGYWYESRRIGNRVTKQYLGNNAFASLLVQSDAMLRPQEAAAKTGAHKRYLSAIKTLAQVQKLQLPSVQFNVAEKQVNIGRVTT